jgi:pyruvate ferredoxin oxidoreductase alpha subunit
VREALPRAQRVVVLEKALAVGIGGIVLATDVAMALARRSAAARLHTVIAGLGGRRSPRLAASLFPSAARAMRSSP